jgi:hypothetical protein
MSTAISLICSFVVLASAAAQTPSPTPWPPKFQLHLETLPDSDVAVARIGDQRFRSVAALEDFIATLPPRSRVVFIFGPQGVPPQCKPFMDAFPELKKFCASKGMTFTDRYPDW